jgi:hypothetical protein
MAKRRSKQNVGAKQDAPPFDYSEAEWSEIEAAARAVLPDGKALPNEVRETLVEYARLYQIRIRMPPLSKDNQDWQKVARLSERLHQALKVVSERIDEPEGQKFFRRRAEATLKRLLEIKELAEEMNISPKHMGVLWKIVGGEYLPPRLRYQSDVLEVWASLGGQLRFSRSKKGPQGPLIRFFQAVTSPVMGASAPSAESIPDIIRRKKRFRGRRLAEVAAEWAPLQKANGDSK